MSITALNPAIAMLLQSRWNPAPVAKAASAPSPAAATQPASLTGSTTGALSSEMRSTLLATQEDDGTTTPSWYGSALKSYDTDQNGDIDASEWQRYAAIGQKAFGQDAKALDLQSGTPGAAPHQRYPETVTLIPLENETPSSAGG